MNKIKGKLGVDTNTLVCLFIIILVGLSSFGLGRLSVSKNDEGDSIILDNNISSNVKEEIGNNKNIKKDVIENTSQKEKMYIASKNGKLYYDKDCSGAKRITGAPPPVRSRRTVQTRRSPATAPERFEGIAA